ncbi:MAG TPA: isoprenylcysteine carboxylmethyltransferase family protein [Gemmatimonadaceae bacterium]
MSLSPFALLSDLWIGFLLVWLVGALFTKRVVRRQPFAHQFAQRVLGLSAAILMFAPGFRVGWLGWRFVAPSLAIEYVGVAITVAGIAFSIWARVVLGGNWSANVTVKESHELVLRGPYALVRHPIYTGITLAGVGTALALGEVRGALAVALGLLAWRIKWPVEERFMIEQFGDQYADYRRHVKALIPGVW